MGDIPVITFHGVNESTEQPQSRLKLFIYAVLEIAEIVQSRQQSRQHPFEETIRLDVGRRKASTKDDENVITNEKAATI